jgi:hypothetical protein
VRLRAALADELAQVSGGRERKRELGLHAKRTRQRESIDPYLPLDDLMIAHVTSHSEVHGIGDQERHQLLEHWGLRPPVVVKQAGQGHQSDSLQLMLESLNSRLIKAELSERTHQARIMAARLVAETQTKALERVSDKLGVRFRKPGAPRLILSLYDRQENVGQISMDLQKADWRALQVLIQSTFGRPADLGYYASDAIQVGDEQVREHRRLNKRRSAQLKTYEAPLQMSPARSKSSRVLRVYDKKTFEIFVVRAKIGGLFAMDQIGGA